LFALLEEQYAARHGKPRWGDKSLNTERYAAAIFAAYPDARIIHMLRDPRDRYASSKTRWEARRGGVGAGVAEWLASVRTAERNARAFPGRVLVVRYEDLTRDPHACLAQVCDFIREPFAAEMFSLSGAPVFRDKGSNSSYGARDVGTIAPDSIGRYRRVLSATDVKFIDVVAAEEMERYGYKPDAQPLAGASRVRFVLGDLPLESCRLLAWRLREASRNRRGRPVPSYRLVDPAVPA
jgi:hypothetical protein